MASLEKFRQDFENALTTARSKQAEIICIEFPQQDRGIFSKLSSIPVEQKFFIENRNRKICELGLGICKSVPAGTPVKCSYNGEKTPIDFFCAIPFYCIETPMAHIAKWQISLRENSAKFLRNISIDETIPSAESLWEEYEKLLNTENLEDAFLTFSKEEEVGGNWYLPACEKAVTAIEKGEIQKVVLARAIDFLSDSRIPSSPLFLEMRERFADKNCTIFLFSETGKETFLGATPEILLKIENNILETEAIAGSIANNNSETQSLSKQILADDKELREHKAVVDFIIQKLLGIGIELTQTYENPETIVLPNVIHLRTPIRAKIPPKISALNILTQLHPTPAMCGVPRDQALKHIISTEPFPRENFAGPVGFYRENGDGFFAVGIRCAKICGNKIRIYAGSGLVSGSTPTREFSEIETKLSAIKNILRTIEK